MPTAPTRDPQPTAEHPSSPSGPRQGRTLFARAPPAGDLRSKRGGRRTGLDSGDLRARERGSRSSQAPTVDHGGVRLNLVDTPGKRIRREVERSLLRSGTQCSAGRRGGKGPLTQTRYGSRRRWPGGGCVVRCLKKDDRSEARQGRGPRRGLQLFMGPRRRRGPDDFTLVYTNASSGTATRKLDEPLRPAGPARICRVTPAGVQRGPPLQLLVTKMSANGTSGGWRSGDLEGPEPAGQRIPVQARRQTTRRGNRGAGPDRPRSTDVAALQKAHPPRITERSTRRAGRDFVSVAGAAE